MEGKKHNMKNQRKDGAKFNSKRIKHDPQAESARDVFGLRDVNPQNDK
jgi:hypothetical protein